ncbi:MAG: TetR/AcrR family transcriptional regulator [Acidimicrobiales bacterium]|nr:TetR/AcrR family transcriptional regulator [Acidimicrobiales bacterium]
MTSVEDGGVSADSPGPESLDDPAGASILDAAMRLLAEGGLAAFTTDRLASTARVSKSSIYRRWPDKKSIFLALMKQWGRRAEVDDMGDLRSEIAQWYADRQRTYNSPGFRQVSASLVELAAHDSEIDEVLNTYRRSSWNTVREILKRAIDRGEIAAGGGLERMEQFFLGPLYFRAVLEGQEIDDATVVDFQRLALAAVGLGPEQQPGVCVMDRAGAGAEQRNP